MEALSCVVDSFDFLPLSTVNPRFLPLATVTSHFLPLLTIASHFLPLLTVTPAWVEGLAASSGASVRGSFHSLGVVTLGRGKRSPKLLLGVIPDPSPGDFIFHIVVDNPWWVQHAGLTVGPRALKVQPLLDPSVGS